MANLKITDKKYEKAASGISAVFEYLKNADVDHRWAGIALVSLTLIIGGAFAWQKLYNPKSVTIEEPVKARVVKVVKTYKDVATARRASQDSNDRRLTVLEIQPGNEILSVVTNVVEEFRLPSGANVAATSVRIENADRKELSSGDLAVAPFLSSKQFQNAKGGGVPEFGIYSVTDPVFLVMNVRADDGSDLRTLTHGAFETYVTIISP